MTNQISTREQAIDLLNYAAENLSLPGAWIKGDLARNSEGMSCNPTDIDAVSCVCAIGALQNAQAVFGAPTEAYSKAHSALKAAIGLTSYNDVETWNDKSSRRKHQVVRAFDDAIFVLAQQG